jgi:hypothetical protein
VDFELLETHWRDLIEVTLSIYTGRILAPAAARRSGAPWTRLVRSQLPTSFQADGAGILNGACHAPFAKERDLSTSAILRCGQTLRIPNLTNRTYTRLKPIHLALAFSDVSNTFQE